MALGLPRAAELVVALDKGHPEVSVRPNRRKPWLPDVTDGCVPWSPGAVYLGERPRFTLMPQLHQGRFYVQDASSMFIGEVIRQQFGGSGPLVWLDACAAPGGKTTAAIDALPEGSLIVANEFDRKRAMILEENVIKWGSPSVIVSQGDTSRISKLKSTFDVVTVDAPCSGEGMMRKEPEAVAQWSPSLVEECAALQGEIVDNVWPALKPGGLLIYSTCTFNRRENEDRVAQIISDYGAEPVEIAVDPSWGVIRSPLLPGACCLRFMPGTVRGEGLFMAVLRKPGVPEPVKQKKIAPSPVKSAVKGPEEWLTAPEDYALRTVGDSVYAFPVAHLPVIDRIEKALGVIYRGVRIATVRGRDLIPDHALAMSDIFRRDAFPFVELDETAALAYLRRDSLTLPDGSPRGYVTVTYGGCPLGFMKNLGNRANNLYPQYWKIRTLHA